MIFAIALLVFRNLVFFRFEIVGSYLSNAGGPTLEMPGIGAELYLHSDGTYSSNNPIMGKGTYQLKGSVIIFSNKSKGWHLPLAREYNIGKPMILINEDWGYYFFKK